MKPKEDSMGELQSAIDIAKSERLTPQAVYDAMKRGELTPSITTKGGRMLFTGEEVDRWRAYRRDRRNTAR